MKDIEIPNWDNIVDLIGTSQVFLCFLFTFDFFSFGKVLHVHEILNKFPKLSCTKGILKNTSYIWKQSCDQGLLASSKTITTMRTITLTTIMIIMIIIIYYKK